jgi:hypothetical protein
MTEKDRIKEIYLFNIVTEAKMLTAVQMSKRYYPADQIRQFLVTMLEKALQREGIP